MGITLGGGNEVGDRNMAWNFCENVSHANCTRRNLTQNGGVSVVSHDVGMNGVEWSSVNSLRLITLAKNGAR
jgi:hypothetical protein